MASDDDVTGAERVRAAAEGTLGLVLARFVTPAFLALLAWAGSNLNSKVDAQTAAMSRTTDAVTRLETVVNERIGEQLRGLERRVQGLESSNEKLRDEFYKHLAAGRPGGEAR